MYSKNAWEKYNDKKLNDLMKFNEEYKDFLSKSKTERLAVEYSINLAEKYGFKELSEFETLKAGDKVYVTNREKNICVFVIGEEPIENGLNVLGAHIDSPRLDIKQNPVYESHGFALLDTHYYGGIVKYQWVARNLAIHGVVCKKDGLTVEVSIGEDETDPVLCITDLLPHLAADKNTKPGTKVVEGEDLNVCVGSIPAKGKDAKEAVKKNILNLLKKEYGIV